MDMRASDFRRIARENLSGHWLISALVCFIAGLLGGTSSSDGSANVNFEWQDLKAVLPPEVLEGVMAVVIGILIYAVIYAIVAFIIGGVVQLGLISYFLNQHDGKRHEVRDLFSQFFNFGGGFCLRLLTSIYTALWTLLLIIPGIIKAYSYAMAPYIMAEHPELSANECITKSRKMMDGYKFKLFCLDLSFIGWAILCIFTLGIGALFLSPYTEAARAAFYRNLCPEGSPSTPD